MTGEVMDASADCRSATSEVSPSHAIETENPPSPPTHASARVATRACGGTSAERSRLAGPVLVDAILVEMSYDKSMDLGINWLVADTAADGISVPAGGFVQPVDGTGIGQIMQGILNPDALGKRI